MERIILAKTQGEKVSPLNSVLGARGFSQETKVIDSTGKVKLEHTL